MEIKQQNDEIVLQKLGKIKCCQGCLNYVNYLVFELGLYCTGCLSKLKDISAEHFINLEKLSKIIAGLAESYEINSKNQAGIILFKLDSETLVKDTKQLRDSLSNDIKAIESNTKNILNKYSANCQEEHRSSALESFFAPNAKNQSELIAHNLKNLLVSKVNGKIAYSFKDSTKQPQKSHQNAIKVYNSVRTCILEARRQTNRFLEDFRAQAIKK